MEVEEEEYLLWSAPGADCYKVLPGHSSSEGVYSGTWGPDNYLATVSAEIFVRGDLCRLHLVLPAGETFAEVNVEPPFEKAIEECLDSSRYVVITIADRAHPGRKAVIGMGFQDRPVAFDFKTILKDHLRRVEFRAAAKEKSKTEPVKDYSIPAGEKISLSLGASPGKKAAKKPKGKANMIVLPMFDKKGSQTPPPSSDPFEAKFSNETVESDGVFGNSVDFGATNAEDPFGTTNDEDPFGANNAEDPFGNTAPFQPSGEASVDTVGDAEGAAADPFGNTSVGDDDPFASKEDPFASSESPFTSI